MATKAKQPKARKNPAKYFVVDHSGKKIGKPFTTEKGAEKKAADLNKKAGRQAYFPIGTSWDLGRENPGKKNPAPPKKAAKAKKNPPAPVGAATERVDLYFRTPRFKKDRAWLEENLGQIRLFEYNPKKLDVEKTGPNSWAVFLNKNMITRPGPIGAANKDLKGLVRRAAAIQGRTKKNPGNHTPTMIAADMAGEFIHVFDTDRDGEVDQADIKLLRAYPGPVFGHAGKGAFVTGTIANGKPQGGKVFVKWNDGKKTKHAPGEFIRLNGFGAWRLERKAAKKYRKALKLRRKAAKASAEQRKYERELAKNPAVKKAIKGNPGMLEGLATAAMGLSAAMDVQSRLAEKPKKRKKAAKKNAGAPSVPPKKAAKAKGNPTTYEDWHGRPPQKMLHIRVPRDYPEKGGWTLGKLLKLYMRGGTILDFSRDTTGKTYYLATTKASKLIFIIGHPTAAADPTIGPNGLTPHGEVLKALYETVKVKFGDTTEQGYIHPMGEEGGRRPILAIDDEGFGRFYGGDYRLTPDGIRN